MLRSKHILSFGKLYCVCDRASEYECDRCMKYDTIQPDVTMKYKPWKRDLRESVTAALRYADSLNWPDDQ